MTRRYTDFTRPHAVCTVGDVIAIGVAAIVGTLGFLFVLLAIIHEATPAHAHWKPEYAQASQETRDWYESRELTPEVFARFHFHSCCNNSDVVKTKFKVSGSGNDEWFWQNGDNWDRIPDDVIHWNEHAPDGQAVLFAVGGRPVCFFPPDSGI